MEEKHSHKKRLVSVYVLLLFVFVVLFFSKITIFIIYFLLSGLNSCSYAL